MPTRNPFLDIVRAYFVVPTTSLYGRLVPKGLLHINEKSTRYKSQKTDGQMHFRLNANIVKANVNVSMVHSARLFLLPLRRSPLAAFP